MNSLKIIKTICILLSSQHILCDFNSSLAAAKEVNTKQNLGLDEYEPRMAFLVGFIERNQKSYFENPYKNVSSISGYLVGDQRCPVDATSETHQGCNVCDIYAPKGDKKDKDKYRLCQWGYNINWPFQYGGTNWGMNGLSQEVKPGGKLINDMSTFQANTNYLVTKEMWGRYPDKRFNVSLAASTIENASGCPDDDLGRKDHWYCANKYIRNSQVNIMSCLKGNDINIAFDQCTNQFNYQKENSNYVFNCACNKTFPATGPDITPAEIQANFP